MSHVIESAVRPRLDVPTIPDDVPEPLRHGDEYFGEWPDRLDPQIVKRLSEVSTPRAVFGIAVEWAGIAAAIAVCQVFWHPLIYLVAVMFIGARQHALGILNHDASHYRLFKNRFWNDALGDLFASWPILITVRWFRGYHWKHHHHLGSALDGNRPVYKTHTADGEPTWLWRFPKNPAELAGILLFDLSGLLGLYYVALTPQRMMSFATWRSLTAQTFFYVAVLSLLVWAGWFTLFLLYWMVPLCTWFMMTSHLRIMAEHSGLPESDNVYAYTRTTLPTWLERIFILPKHVNYHLEHHVHPSVPYYRLPELHREMLALPGFAQQAHLTRSVVGVIRELVQPRSEAAAHPSVTATAEK
jgi:fatty acid desaturase